MSYRMCRMLLGTSKIEPVFDIKTDLVISGLCHIQDFGFLFLFRNNHCIGYSDDKGKTVIPWMGRINEKGNQEGTRPYFEFPSSICYYPNLRSCYLFEDGGSKLRLLEIKNKYCNNISIFDSVKKYYSKIKLKNEVETSCDIDRYGNLYWTAKDLNRCFRMSHGDNVVKSLIGNGHSGFSVSNDLDACLLSRPLGIKCINNVLYVADSSNHCVRMLSANVLSIAMGNPMDEKTLSSPSQIGHNGNVVYVLDGCNIKYLSLKDKNNGIIYTSPNIVAIEGDTKKAIYVLEKS